MRKKTFFYSIRWRMFLCITGIVMGTLLLTALLVGFVMRHYLEESAVETYSLSSRILNSYVEEGFSKIESETESFVFDSVIQRSLEPTPLTYLEESRMSNVWNRISSKYVKNGVYLDNKGHAYIKGNRGLTFSWDAYEVSKLFLATQESYGKLQWVWTEDTIFGTGETGIFLIRNVRNVDRPELSGVLILQMNPYLMEEAMKKADASEQLFYYIFDGEGQLCYEKGWEKGDEEKQQEQIKRIVEVLDFSKKSEIEVNPVQGGILFSCYEPGFGLTVVTEVPDNVIYEMTRLVNLTLLLIAAVMFLIAAAASLGMAYHFTKPISEISQTMEHFDGSSFDDKIKINTRTELDTIGSSYNSMLSRMEQLVLKVKEKEREVWSLELDSLYYQLNPHFLYNTLDNIYMMARIAKQKEIMNMIHALSRLLKISLNKGDGMLTVEEELEHVASYLEIQKMRFGDKFRYQVKCEEDVKNYQTMKLLLQPIVENSVKYGFAGMQSEGVIFINAGLQEGRICFSVYNNGKSIEKEKQHQLNHLKQMAPDGLKESLVTEKGGFGIYNIVTRMRMKYGEAFDIVYSVPEGGGTLCTLYLPLISPKKAI